MRPDEWWKNFALGVELDVAGTFTYNGIKSLHDLDRVVEEINSFRCSTTSLLGPSAC
jgi:hypothetical protein